MRLFHKLRLLALTAVMAAGCVVHDGGGGYPPPQGQPPAPTSDGPYELGLQGVPGYYVLANAETAFPSGAIGYGVTANDRGGYRLFFTDTLNSPAVFSGTIWSDGLFDTSQIRGLSGAEQIVVSNDLRSLSFQSVPGANIDGVDFVPSVDPVYLDLIINGARAGVPIYFTGGVTGAVQGVSGSPVAFMPRR